MIQISQLQPSKRDVVNTQQGSAAASSAEDLQMASSSSTQNASSIAAVNSMNSNVDPVLSSTALGFAGANIGSIMQWLHYADFSWKRKNSSRPKKASPDSLLKATTMIDRSSHKKSVFLCSNFCLGFKFG